MEMTRYSPAQVAQQALQLLNLRPPHAGVAVHVHFHAGQTCVDSTHARQQAQGLASADGMPLREGRSEHAPSRSGCGP